MFPHCAPHLTHRALRRLFVQHGTEPLYSMRKLQDWTSNQLYRWRAALKRGQKPPSPALRKHLASNKDASEESVVAQKSPSTRAAVAHKPIVKVRTTARKPADREKRQRKKKTAAAAKKDAQEQCPAPSDALSNNVSVARQTDTLELAEFGQEELEEALSQMLPTDSGWTAQQQNSEAASLPGFDCWAMAKQTETGTTTPVMTDCQTPAVVRTMLLPEEQPVQDVEQLFRMEEPDQRRDATQSSPVWEADASGVLSEPVGPLSLGQCESAKQCFSADASLERDGGSDGMSGAVHADDASLSSDLSEWGSTTLSRQRSWGAPLPVPTNYVSSNDISAD